MFTPGPSSTATCSALASSPRATPTRSTNAGSQDEPRAAAVGKQVAGTLTSRSRWPASSACLRTPCGPSVSMTAGTSTVSSRRTSVLFQKSAPVHSAAFSARVSSASSAAASSGSLMSGDPHG